MNNTALAGIIVGSVVIAAAGAIAVNSGFNPLQKYATVVSVEPAYDTTRTPREVCGDEATLAQATLASESSVAGAPVQPLQQPQPLDTKALKDDKSGADTVEQCVMVYDSESVQAGYEVTYELDGIQKVVRMDRDPGERIPVEGGELILTQS